MSGKIRGNRNTNLEIRGNIRKILGKLPGEELDTLVDSPYDSDGKVEGFPWGFLSEGQILFFIGGFCLEGNIIIMPEFENWS